MAERINAVKTSFFGKGAIRLLVPELQKMGIRRALLVTDWKRCLTGSKTK